MTRQIKQGAERSSWPLRARDRTGKCVASLSCVCWTVAGRGRCSAASSSSPGAPPERWTTRGRPAHFIPALRAQAAARMPSFPSIRLGWGRFTPHGRAGKRRSAESESPRFAGPCVLDSARKSFGAKQSNSSSRPLRPSSLTPKLYFNAPFLYIIFTVERRSFPPSCASGR